MSCPHTTWPKIHTHVTPLPISHRPTADNGVKIVAVDLQLMAPISGVIQIHGDITKVHSITVLQHVIKPTLIPRPLPAFLMLEVARG